MKYYVGFYKINNCLINVNCKSTESKRRQYRAKNSKENDSEDTDSDPVDQETQTRITNHFEPSSTHQFVKQKQHRANLEEKFIFNI